MIDVLMIVFICLISVLLILANVYLLAYYCHPDDRGFGNALLCKIVVVSAIQYIINYSTSIDPWYVSFLGTSFNATTRCF